MLGEMLVSERLITPEQRDRALAQRLGHAPTVVRDDRLSWDVDVPDDGRRRQAVADEVAAQIARASISAMNTDLLRELVDAKLLDMLMVLLS